VTGEGVLIVVPPPDGTARAITPATSLAGLPLLRRIVLAANAAGYERVLVHARMGPVERVLEGSGAAILRPSDPDPPIPAHRVVLVPSNVVPQTRWLRMLREMPLEAEHVHVDTSMTAVVETSEPRDVVAAARRCASADALVADLRSTFKDVPGPLVPEGRRALAVPADVRATERWLLQSLIKQSEGFMSRHFERRISLACTRWLARTSITPNVMTVVSLTVGLAGAPFFLSSAPAPQLTGALLFLAHSILDGCDGELARLKFMQSRLGAILDYWGDNLVHVAIFGCIAVGWSLAGGSPWPLLLGLIVAVAMLAGAALMFRRTVADQVTTPGAAAADRLAGAVANRDFIYLVILAAAFGKATWCLMAATIGAPAFLVLVLWRDRLRRA
jgi:phosphatidylglycerophosphate synthase